ncbi:MAG TPA: NifB/NifX family molybdenum-iron cluster-binding protein [Phycisphaerae bacterium]|nr:NifB/NifX family molybdenum-iron cluster-binding protein [Phycisphaerae bacterium]
MRIAMAVWEQRVSPLFDVAGGLLLIDAQGSLETARTSVALPDRELPRRVRRLVDLGVDVLICGGISQPLAGMVHASGIRLVPFTAGPVEQVLRAFLQGQLPCQAFVMPGWCGRCRRGFGGGRRGPG